MAAVVLAPAACPRVARADTHESDEDRKAAAKLFGEGQRAYHAGDYRHAAESFEGAYARAPRLPPLWNAARAWQKGGELVRAANLYASYLRKAPPSAPDRNSATTALRDLSTRVAELEVHAASMSDLKLDGTAIELDDQNPSSVAIYVTPGEHVVEGTQNGKVVRQTTTAAIGTSVSVVLIAPVETVSAPPSLVVQEKPSRGWSPIVVAIGGGVTAVAAGLLIASSVDTLSQRSTFDASPTQANLDTGLADQTRTNVLLGVTLGLAVLTGIVAIFLVDWKPRVHASVGLGGGMIGGVF
ncbi:MAG TPA: hypothetical protein VGH28_12755 [Polyangiaceae bacterium]